MLKLPTKRVQAGLSLIELMIAMIVGLIVIGAAIMLVVSLMKSNNESIRSMRLSQEMRAVADIVTMEVRRARSLDDPLANVGLGASAFVTCNDIDVDDPTCLKFAYSCNPSTGAGSFRTISFSDSKIFFATDTAAAPACATGEQLSSNDVVIDSVNFEETATGAIEMTLEGHPNGDGTMSRKLTRVIWPRSARVTP